MELFALRCFVEVARSRGFTRAAAVLGRSQPAVSAQVHNLEEELGGSLIDRSLPGLVLSERGRALLPRAERLIEEAEALQQDLLAEDREPRGRVSIAAGLSVIEGFLPRAIGDLVSRHPGVRLSIHNRTGDGSWRSLVDGKADLALGWLLSGRPRVVTKAIGKVRFAAVSKARPRAAGLEALLARPLLCFEKGVDLRNYLEGRLGAIDAALELPSVASLLAWAARGHGTALVPLLGEGQRLPSGLEVDWLDDLVPPVDLELCRRAGASPSPAVDLVAKAIEKAALS